MRNYQYVRRAGAHLPCSKAKASQQIRAVVGCFCCKVETLHRLFGTFVYHTLNITTFQQLPIPFQIVELFTKLYFYVTFSDILGLYVIFHYIKVGAYI